MKKLTERQEQYLQKIGRLWENYGKKRYYINLKSIVEIEVYGENWDDYKIEGIDIKEENAWKKRNAIGSYTRESGTAKIYYDVKEGCFYETHSCSLEDEINDKLIQKMKVQGNL